MLGIGLVVGGGLGLLLGMRPAPAARTRPATETAADTALSPIFLDTLQPPGSAAPGAPPVAPPVDDSAPAKLCALLATPNPMRHWGEIHEQLSAWCLVDPRAALDFVQQAPRFPQRNSALALPLAAIARTDAASAAAWLLAHGTEIDRRRIGDEVFVTIANEHPREALEFTGAGVRLSDGLLGYAIGPLAATEPDEALALLATLGGSDRVQASMILGQHWAAHDPAAALRWCATVAEERCAVAAANSVLLTIAEQDPRAAAAALGRHNLPDEAIASTLRTIAHTDPALALDAAAKLPIGRQAAVVRPLLEAALEAEPDRVAALGRAVLPTAEFNSVMHQAWTSWRDSDRVAAEAWADTVTDSDLRSRLEGIRLADGPAADPALFLASIESLPDAHREQQSIDTAVANLAPRDAARWLAEHPDLAPAAATVRTAEALFDTDEAAADAWARSLPAGGNRDLVLSSVAANWGLRGETDRATGALATIGDPLVRTATSFHLFRTLHGRNPDAAAAWLATQPLSAEVRANWEAIAAGRPNLPGIEPYE